MTIDDLTITDCGIYGLRCESTGKWYIEQRTDTDYRFYQHKNLENKSWMKDMTEKPWSIGSVVNYLLQLD